jgi:CRP-like cAMP-binding protein
MDKALIARILADFFMFRELSAEQIEMIAEHCQLVDAPRGTTVFNRGDPARGLFLLLRGQLKLGVTSPQGTEKVISIISPGESFGEAVLFMERQFPVYAQATLDAQVLLVSKSVIFSLLDNDPTVARKMLAGLSVRMHQLVQDIGMLSLQSGTQRFIGYLLQISADAPDAGSVTLPASKATIASLLNLTPETLSRTMTKLQQSGLIEVHGKEITIPDVSRLRKLDYSF